MTSYSKVSWVRLPEKVAQILVHVRLDRERCHVLSHAIAGTPKPRLCFASRCDQHQVFTRPGA